MAPESERAKAQKFRKKPVVVEAVQWFKHGDHPMVQPYAEGTVSHYPKYAECGYIKTLESGQTMHHVIPGDWIIRGVEGEHYPCKPDIFAATYKAAENSEQTLETGDGQTKPNEPTLTCSEVVERLQECYHAETVAPDGVREMRSWFDTEQAKLILHSWRERRVQELEKCLREIADTLTAGQGYAGVAERCREYAETALAKHSLSPELSSTQHATTREKK